jgi:hypothetical protein
MHKETLLGHQAKAMTAVVGLGVTLIRPVLVGIGEGVRYYSEHPDV